MHTPIVSVINGEPLASTEVIARGFKVPHRNVIGLVRAHAGTLAEFGVIATQLRFNPRGKPTEFALLNERQATLVMTMLRNTPQVLQFKVDLVREFYRMRDALNQRDQNLWQQMQALIAREVESKVRASFGSHLMLERKREIPYFTTERERLEAELQPSLLPH